MSRGRRGTFAAAFRLSAEEAAMNDPKERGSGHPLPQSAEASTDAIPEHLVREKGHGDDAAAPSLPESDLTGPDGEPYGSKRDKAAHQDRGRGWVEAEEEGS
jgi:hypothetical protein